MSLKSRNHTAPHQLDAMAPKRKPGPPMQDGSGLARMRRNLGGDEAAEALRQQVLKDQAAAMAGKPYGKPRQRRDRSHYTDYPPPKKR